jgi:hypothetical protein
MYASRNGGGPPAWIVFLAGVALIFGLYYVWIGVRDFLANGINPAASVQQTDQDLTAVFEEAVNQSERPTARPTLTPLPTCQKFSVRTPTVNVRAAPDISAAFIEMREQGTEICVLGLEAGTDSYLIDMDTSTRRIEAGYIRSDLLTSANPSPTPFPTSTPAPTITLTPSHTPTITATPSDTATRTPRPSQTPLPSRTPRA